MIYKCNSPEELADLRRKCQDKEFKSKEYGECTLETNPCQDHCDHMRIVYQCTDCGIYFDSEGSRDNPERSSKQDWEYFSKQDGTVSEDGEQR